jgi:hypothetical protein
MAAFREHITVSSALGLGYAGTLVHFGVEWVHAALAAALCGVAGMLPDLDSDSGRPMREVFGVTAVLAPLLLFRRMDGAGLSPEAKILLAGAIYLAVRFGLAWLFQRMTVHRGMFHSIPAAVIAAECVFLAHDCPEPYGRLTLAGGVLIGYLSHLVLDEIYAVDSSGLLPRLNKAAGSAFKLFSPSLPATLCTWLVLATLTYLAAVEQGYVEPVRFSIQRMPAISVREGASPRPSESGRGADDGGRPSWLRSQNPSGGR